MKTTDTIPLAGLRYDLLRHYLALVAVLAFGLVLAADVHAQTRGGRGSTSGGASRTEEDRSDDRRERARPAPQATPQQPTRQAEPRTREQSTSRGSTGGSRPSRTAEPERVNRERTQTPAAEPDRSGDTGGRGSVASGDRGSQGRGGSGGRATAPSGNDARGNTGSDARRDRVDRRDARRDRRDDGRIYVPSARDNRYYRPRPHVHIDIDWPWEHRYRRHWAPRYMYRQVVVIESGWARRHYSARIDVRTFYRHRVVSATRDRAVIDVEIDRIELYENNRFLGAVEHIPNSLDRIRATVYRNGRVAFDRDVFIVGDPRAGFEIVSTRHYDGFVLNHYNRSHGYRVGALDLWRERVVETRHSRLFDPYDFNGYVPVSLLPEDRGWLYDYGAESVSGYYWGDDDEYYYGRSGDGYDAYEGDGYYPRLDDERAAQRPSDGTQPPLQVRPDGTAATPQAEPLRRSRNETFRTEQGGADIRLQRETELKRIE